jgi:hypothetical protein
MSARRESLAGLQHGLLVDLPEDVRQASADDEFDAFFMVWHISGAGNIRFFSKPTEQ